MGGISQNLKATINIGGKLDVSWTKSADALKASLSTVGKTSQKLSKDQEKLAEKIRQAKLAGKNVSELTKDYKKVSTAIQKTNAEQDKLNQSLEKANRLKQFGGMGKGILRRSMGIAGQLGNMMGGGLLIGGGGIVGTAMGALLSPASVNAHTAEQAGIARSYGVSSETFNAWDSLAKQFGMNGENVGDLFEEYLHKAGEYKQNGKQGGLQDAFETLGFKAGDFAGLSDMEQFNKIIERALTLKDDSKSSFALDSLFGGEASKWLMLLKQSGKTLKENMDEQRRYNLVTEEGAAGAIEGNRAMSNLQLVLSSAVAEISGQLGNELSPQVRSLTDDLAKWFRDGGISKVTQFLKNDLYPSALAFGEGLVYVGKVVYALARKLSWLLPDEKEDKHSVMRALAMTGSVPIAQKAAESVGLTDWFTQQLKANPDLQKDVVKAYTSTRGFLSDDNEGFFRQVDQLTGESAPSSSAPFSWDDEKKKYQDVLSQDPGDSSFGFDSLLRQMSGAGDAQQPLYSNNSRNTFQFDIHVDDAESGKAIAGEITDRIKNTGMFDDNNALYDGGYNW